MLVFKYLFDALTNAVFLTPAWMEFTMAGFSVFLLVVAAIMLAKLVDEVTNAQSKANHAWSAFE